MRAMISVPMRGRPTEDKNAAVNRARAVLEKWGYVVVDTDFYDEYVLLDGIGQDRRVNKGVYFLGKALQKMAECDAVYFCHGWETARGCAIEHMVARQYNVICFYEDVDAPTRGGDEK